MLNSVRYDFKMQFSHARNEMFACLLVYLNTNHRVFLADFSQNFNQARQVFRVFRLHRNCHDRLAVMSDALKRRHLNGRERRAYDRILHADECCNVPCGNLLNFNTLRTHVNADLLHPVLLVSAGNEEFNALA